MNIAQRIKHKRLELGLSQPKLAKLCHWSNYSRISHYEMGRREPRREEIISISKALGVTPEWLQFGTGEGLSFYEKIPKGYVPILEWDEVMEWCIKDDKELAMDETNRFYIGSPTPDNFSKYLFALKVKNNIMASGSLGDISFQPGSYIIADPDYHTYHESYIIGAWSGASDVIFRQYIIEGGKSYLRPLNSQYPIQEVNSNFTPLATIISRIDLIAPLKKEPFLQKPFDKQLVFP